MPQQKWIANDGQIFDTKNQAEEYENKMRFIHWVRDANRSYQEKHKVQMSPTDMAKAIWDNWDVEPMINEVASVANSSS